jgi:hypothetical protein
MLADWDVSTALDESAGRDVSTALDESAACDVPTTFDDILGCEEQSPSVNIPEPPDR